MCFRQFVASIRCLIVRRLEESQVCGRGFGLFCGLTFAFAVGANNGQLTMYELRQGKNTTIQAHSSAITAAAFSPDGKFLVSYACGENKLSFWQTSTGAYVFWCFRIDLLIFLWRQQACSGSVPLKPAALSLTARLR